MKFRWDMTVLVYRRMITRLDTQLGKRYPLFYMHY